jgi:hypothetical protein
MIVYTLLLVGPHHVSETLICTLVVPCGGVNENHVFVPILIRDHPVLYCIVAGEGPRVALAIPHIVAHASGRQELCQ